MSKAAAREIREHVIFTGRVQGVCFRATSVELARQLPVAGWVRNLPDGTVELEAQGAPDAVETLLARIQEHYRGHIRDVQRSPATPEDDPRGFQVR